MHLGEVEGACRSFRAALKINPHDRGLRRLQLQRKAGEPLAHRRDPVRLRLHRGVRRRISSPEALGRRALGLHRHPGVFEFHQGQRVIEAIERAGGARPGADLTSINLAALLTDAMQIVVAKRGQPGAPSGSGAGSSIGQGGGAGEVVVNLNTATLDQLDSLPGIGPALAQRIISYREQHGPFRSVQELLNVSGIGEKKFADLRSKVTV